MAFVLTEDDFCEEGFNATEIVERLSRKPLYLAKEQESQEFDPQPLIEALENGIQHILGLEKDLQTRIEQQEYLSVEAEQKYILDLSHKANKFSDITSQFSNLEDGIKCLSAKSVHIGDQLDSIYSKRMKALEAQKLMLYFRDFADANSELPNIFSDPEQVHKAADAVQKLYFIVQDLTSPDYLPAKSRIKERYSLIETTLLNRFQDAYRNGDVQEMKNCSNTLFTFKGYDKCLEMYINQHRFFFDSFTVDREEISTDSTSVFQDIISTCRDEHEVINFVFRDPERVMTLFLERIFEQYLQSYIETALKQALVRGKLPYLKTLDSLFERSMNLSDQLGDHELGLDPHLISSLIDAVFCPYLDSYIEVESNALQEVYQLNSQSFYALLNHAKTTLPQCRGIEKENFLASQEQVEFLQFMNTINPAETYISIELALTLIHDHKSAQTRCQRLSRPSELGANSEKLFVLLMDHLVVEHITYAVDIASMSLPIHDSRVETMVKRFYEVVHGTNYIFHLLQNHFRSIILPIVYHNFVAHAAFIERKNAYMENLEARLDFGLNQALTWFSIQLKSLFKKHQIKTDFKPSPLDSDQVLFHNSSLASINVLNFLRQQFELISKSLDGKNLEKYLFSIATRFHDIFLENIKNFTISIMGGMLLARDIMEYQNFFKAFNSSQVDELLDNLRDVGNIFIVRPENLKEVCNEAHLANMDRRKLWAFVELREDFRSANISKYLSHISS